MKSFRDFIREENSITAAITFGRFNPPTIGHLKLIDRVAEVAKSVNGKFLIFVSNSIDPKKNPLHPEEKVKWMRKMFPKYARNIIYDSSIKTILDALIKLSKEGIKRVIIIVGQDRIEDFKRLVHKYNGVEMRNGSYEFDNIDVISAGDRDPDDDNSVNGVSASKMRAAAKDNDFSLFKSFVPSGFMQVHDLFTDLRHAMGIHESIFRLELKLPSKSTIREDHITGKHPLIKNDTVMLEDSSVGKILSLKSNYVILEMDNKEKRTVWLSDIIKKL